MTKKLLPILMLFALALISAAATGRLNVKVRDDKGKALEYVNVSILKDSLRITGGQTNARGNVVLMNIPPDSYTVRFTLIGYKSVEIESVKIKAGKTTTLSPVLARSGVMLMPIGKTQTRENIAYMLSPNMAVSDGFYAYAPAPGYGNQYPPDWNTEDYNAITPNIFHSPLTDPLSTFSIDVDTATYSNVRRLLNQGQLPTPNTVRGEEIINYFSYDYPEPKGEHPFSVYTELGVCPWNPRHNLVHIGIQGRKIDMSLAPANNLVFLLDVSGSMDYPNKLPLVKQSMKLLLDNLRPKDRVAIVVYAGAAGLVLPPTSGEEKAKISA
ncbi:MAG TPA: von Willebrand factor type A domain-containing protein, partial [Candidatus Syntrophosphaera sp.]|nr:von Willebrand factor type A domain-containing protein [Candidatus Syntrophosphaera sp.]